LRTSAIPVEPVPLTADQAETMLQRQFKKHHVAIMLLHWFNAAVWLAELVTGVGLVTSRHFRVAPEWYLSVAQGLFGSRANMLQVHIALGLLWMGVFLVYGIFGFRTYLGQEVLRKEIALDRDDIRWLIVRTRQIIGLTKDRLPPQGIYNAGQKLFAVMVYLALPVIMLTGVVVAFHLFGTQAVGWAIVLHFAAVGVVVSGLIVHVYMGAVFPEEKPAFFSMITGNVNELYAYSHHFKWWRELMIEERQWERDHEDRLGAPPAAGSTRMPEPVSARPEPPISEQAADASR
jgi:formate dehydrogenase gamma subunit